MTYLNPGGKYRGVKYRGVKFGGAFFRSKRYVAVVDMGVSAFKVVVAEKLKDDFKISHFSLVPYTLKVSSVRELMDARDFSKELKLVLDFIPARIKEIGLVLPGFFTMLKSFCIDTDKLTGNIKDVIRESLSSSFPFDLKDLAYDYWLHSIREDKVDVLCVVSQKNIIRRYSQIFQQANRELIHIDTPFTALANLFFYNVGVTDTPTALIDVGKIGANIVIVDGTKLVFAKSLPDIGGDFINRRIAYYMGIPEGSEEMNNLEKQKVTGMIPNDVIEKVIEDFSDVFVQNTTHFLSEYGVEKAFITGGSSSLPGLTSSLSSKLGFKVNIFPVVDNVKISEDIDRVYIEEAAGRLSVAIGGIINLVM